MVCLEFESIFGFILWGFLDLSKKYIMGIFSGLSLWALVNFDFDLKRETD